MAKNFILLAAYSRWADLLKRFSIAALGPETKLIYENQRIWEQKNWRESLRYHSVEIEEMLTKLSCLDIWNSKLQSVSAAKELIPEIWMDDYVSITQACAGLYKYANMSLRTSLETTLRLIYFSEHPVEHNWWKSGLRFGQDQERHDVWGANYDYFGLLFVEFEQECVKESMDLFKFNGKRLVNLYSNLSGSIHTHAKRLQTTSGYSPKYNRTKFVEWKDYFCQINTYLNILLALKFQAYFKKFHLTDKTKILDIGIGDYYGDKIASLLF
jgi:hypothetical protein